MQKSHDTRHGLDRVDLDEAGQLKNGRLKIHGETRSVQITLWLRRLMDEYTYQIVVRKEFLTADKFKASSEAELNFVLAPYPNGSFSK